jgi:chlorobactene glucosyltransferase
VAKAAANGDPRLRVLSGAPLPQGWVGKVWACHQLSQAATGDILVFTDADVRWAPGALAALIARMARTRADLLSVWPTQETVTWAERLVVPLMAALPAMGYLPVLLVHHTPWACFATANGQCLAFRRSAYDKIGGHASVRGSIVEDVALARRIKSAYLGLRLAEGAGLITCLMYRDWPSVRDGFAKNILVGHGDRLELLGANVLLHWVIYVWPWLWLLFGWMVPGHPDWPTVPLALAALGVGIRALSAASTRQRLRDSFLIPVSVLLVTLIALRATWWLLRYRGPIWKGRAIARASTK